MEDLLRTDFTAHYGLPICTTTNITEVTIEPYFEIEDTEAKEIMLHIARGRGMANFSNPSKMQITIANYDKFVTSLPNHFQEGKKRCDIIVTCNTNKYFVLGELKDSPNIKNHRTKAKKQLVQSLRTLIEVNEILDYINAKSIKRCCYFNKQSKSPAIINAVTAFNRLANVFPDGFKMTHSDIEALGFEFWEYTGEQTLTMTA